MFLVIWYAVVCFSFSPTSLKVRLSASKLFKPVKPVRRNRAMNKPPVPVKSDRVKNLPIVPPRKAAPPKPLPYNVHRESKKPHPAPRKTCGQATVSNTTKGFVEIKSSDVSQPLSGPNFNPYMPPKVESKIDSRPRLDTPHSPTDLSTAQNGAMSPSVDKMEETDGDLYSTVTDVSGKIVTAPSPSTPPIPPHRSPRPASPGPPHGSPVPLHRSPRPASPVPPHRSPHPASPVPPHRSPRPASPVSLHRSPIPVPPTGVYDTTTHILKKQENKSKPAPDQPAETYSVLARPEQPNQPLSITIEGDTYSLLNIDSSAPPNMVRSDL